MGITEGKNKKNNKKNDNEVKDIYGFTKDGIKSCAGQDKPDGYSLQPPELPDDNA